MNKRTKIIVATIAAVAVIAASCIGVLYSRYATAWKNYENQNSATHKQYSVVQENSKKLETMIGDEETFLAQTMQLSITNQLSLSTKHNLLVWAKKFNSHKDLLRN